jgi:hypothetical protein
MTVDAISQEVIDVQSIQTIVMALAIAEGFKQTVREQRPVDEKHAVTLKDWFECVFPNRLVSLLVFLLLAVPMFLGNQKYLYTQYIAPLHSANPPERVSPLWLNVDGLIFLVEAGLLFVMSRSLSARRWQQFYGTVLVLMALDAAWVLAARGHGAGAPLQWLWFDLIAVGICAVFLVADRFFVRYDRGRELNLWCFVLISVIAILGQMYGYLYQVDYLVEK